MYTVNALTGEEREKVLEELCKPSLIKDPENNTLIIEDEEG